MKLLVAVQSKDITLINKSLRWAGRTGYALRIFIDIHDWEPCVDKLKDINMNYYLNINDKNLVTDVDPMTYAKENGFDLLLRIPEHRRSFSGKRKRINLDTEVIEFLKAVGTARTELSQKPWLDSVILKRGITMERVQKGVSETTTT